MKHLNQSERYQISALREAGMGVNAIAKAVGRPGSAVSRELRRNSDGDGCVGGGRASSGARTRRNSPTP